MLSSMHSFCDWSPNSTSFLCASRGNISLDSFWTSGIVSISSGSDIVENPEELLQLNYD